MKFRNYRRYMVTGNDYDWATPELFKTKKEALAYLQAHRAKRSYGCNNWVIVEMYPRRIIMLKEA
jgi:hypothetical protein